MMLEIANVFLKTINLVLKIIKSILSAKMIAYRQMVASCLYRSLIY